MEAVWSRANLIAMVVRSRAGQTPHGERKGEGVAVALGEEQRAAERTVGREEGEGP
jgi:hypothetical protein